MNKKIVVAASAALLMPAIAHSAPEIYGVAHVTVNRQDSAGEIRMTSPQSRVGVRGSEDMESGLKLVYQVEFGFDASECRDTGNACPGGGSLSDNTIRDRDQWLGLASQDYGSFRFGTISTSYKSSGASIDPLYDTFVEGRRLLMQQSRLHVGTGPTGGRSTNTIRYDSPVVNGVRLVANYAMGEGTGNTLGGGVHYQAGGVKAHVDFIEADDAGGYDGMAWKIGGQYDFGNGLLLNAQYESGDAGIFATTPPTAAVDPAESVETVYMVNGAYIIGNTALVVSYGAHQDYSAGYAFAVDHKLSKSADAYFAYGAVNYDVAGSEDDDIVGLGLRYAF